VNNFSKSVKAELRPSTVLKSLFSGRGYPGVPSRTKSKSLNFGKAVKHRVRLNGLWDRKEQQCCNKPEFHALTEMNDCKNRFREIPIFGTDSSQNLAEQTHYIPHNSSSLVNAVTGKVDFRPKAVVRLRDKSGVDDQHCRREQTNREFKSFEAD
jgi:hypothetical protein